MNRIRSFHILLIACFIGLWLQGTDSAAQIKKDSAGYTVFNPEGQDSIPDSPTLQSIFRDKPSKTIDRVLWYRFGPKVGYMFPLQPRLVNTFNSLTRYASVDIIYSLYLSGFGPTLDYFSISKRANFREPSQIGTDPKRDRFTILAPSYSYQHFFIVQPDFIPFVEVDAKYIVGVLRVHDQHIDTGLQSSFGASVEAGALFSDRFRLNMSYFIMRPIKGYSLNGISATFSFLFYSVHTW